MPVRDVLTLLIFLAVTVRVWQRVTRASPLMRRILTPVLFVAGARVLLDGDRRRGAVGRSRTRTLTEALALIVAFALPAIAAAFFVGLFQRRLYAADALQKLAAHVTGQEHARARCGPRSPMRCRTPRFRSSTGQRDTATTGSTPTGTPSIRRSPTRAGT